MPEVFNSDEDAEKNSNLGMNNSNKDVPDESLIHPPSGVRRHKIKGHTHNPFASFCLHPDHAKFINQDPEEKVILLLRKHPVTNVGWLALSLILIVTPGFISVTSSFELLPSGFQVILVLVWYLMVSAFILEEFLKWFFHVNIITDERIIEVDFINLIYRELTDANIDQIQDVTVEIGGGLRTFLGYGDVVVQTAGAIPKVEFEAVPDPDTVSRILRELRIEEEREKLEGRIR